MISVFKSMLEAISHNFFNYFMLVFAILADDYLIITVCYNFIVNWFRNYCFTDYFLYGTEYGPITVNIIH